MDEAPHWAEGGFGLYVHWPFCLAKCPYCDFNSHVVAAVDDDRWTRAYLTEIARVGAETPGRVLRSVFFGGGTPSLMAPETVAAILDAVRATWPMTNDPEITLEANPTSVEAGRFRAFREAGVNRVSVGIQALDDGALKALGRMHDVREGRAAYDLARAVFPRVSFDLIYARQHQDRGDWRRELGEALGMAADHLSLYQLTIEDGTAFARRYAAGGLTGLPDDDLGADLWAITQEMTEAAGFPAYEVSNHAKQGEQGRHNLIYWSGGDYAGIGPGAHGRLTLGGSRMATETAMMPMDWLRRVEIQGSGETLRTALTIAEQRDEFLMMGLRMRDGVSLERLRRLSGDELSSRINALQDIGMVSRTADRLQVTPQGRPLLNAILRELIGPT